MTDDSRTLVSSLHLSSLLDHCETNHAVHPHIAEFWNTVSASAFIFVGVLALARHGRGGSSETRYKALAIFCILSGVTGVWAHATLHGLALKLDHIMLTLTFTLFLWLIDGDDYLLIFWQIHALFSTYATAAFHWFYPIHMNIVAVAIFCMLWRKMQMYPDAPNSERVLNLAVVVSLAASTLLASDHLACGHSLALPQMHAVGQVLVALVLHYAYVLHLYLRQVQLGQPCEIAFRLQFWPYVRKLTKAHNA
eukprot:TRINITY_DN17115_c0_g1_i4.p1 TRINITY_DN17115_c0_g1~~TRINITY_DN17115_c0_g1_i4.p1  ORF type:complete len:251 (+),score=9.66 TRINITY_DN17115_c0_g1_i4:243-995(+)